MGIELTVVTGRSGLFFAVSARLFCPTNKLFYFGLIYSFHFRIIVLLVVMYGLQVMYEVQGYLGVKAYDPLWEPVTAGIHYCRY